MHEHVAVVKEWGFNDKYDYLPILYTCKYCDEESKDGFADQTEPNAEHKEHVGYVEGCFACKVGTLQVNTGDAGRAESMSQRKWDAELDAYKAARAEGIQPAGTSMKAVEEARQASDNLGRAFNAETMGAAKEVTKEKAKAMNQVGE